MEPDLLLELINRQSDTIKQLVNDLKVERQRNKTLQDMLSPPVPDYQRTQPKSFEQSRRELENEIEVGG